MHLYAACVCETLTHVTVLPPLCWSFCRFLREYKAQHESAHPRNRMEVVTTVVNGEEQYVHSMIILASGVNAVESGDLLNIITVDASHSGLQVDVPSSPHSRAGKGQQSLGVILNCVAVDGLRRPLLLAFGHFDIENSDNYVAFLSYVRDHYGTFPMFEPALTVQHYDPGVEYDNGSGYLIFMGDHSAALTSARKAVFPGALPMYCTRHRSVRDVGVTAQAATPFSLLFSASRRPHVCTLPCVACARSTQQPSSAIWTLAN